MAAQNQPLRIATRRIITACRDRLVNESVLPQDRIMMVARVGQLVPKFQADQELLLRPRGFTSMELQQIIVAAGEYDSQQRRVLEVYLRVRKALDESDRDDHWLIDETDGYFDLEDAVVNALHMFWPHTASGDAMLAYPMRYFDSVAPEKSADATWGDCIATFVMVYQPLMSVPKIDTATYT